MEPLQRKNVLLCWLLVFVFKINSESFNTTENAEALHCLRELGDNTKEQAISSVFVENGSATWFSAKKSLQGLGMASSAKLV